MLGKDNQPKTKRVGRIRLETFVNGTPRLHDVRMLLSEAQKNKGSLCELVINGAKGAFLLSCQSDGLSAEPCWTFYSGSDGSQQIWSYMDSNIEMLTDVVVMTMTEGATGSSVDLKSFGLTPAPGADDASSALGNSVPSESYPAGVQSAPNSNAQVAQNNWNSQPANNWAQGAQQFDGSWNQAAQPFNWPGAQGESGWGPQGNNPYAPDTASAGSQYPPAQPPQGYAYGAPNTVQPQQASGAPFDRFSSEAFAQSMMPSYASSQTPAVSPTPTPSPSPVPSASPVPAPSPTPAYSPTPSVSRATDPKLFLSYLDQNKHLTVGELVFNPNLPPNCADAAMRLQELVCKNAIDEKSAREALKIAVANDGVLDDQTLSAARARAADDPDELARKAGAILQQAGLITEQDLAKAEAIAAKIGTNVGDALISGGKIDKLLLDSSQKCHTYIKKGTMRPDQAIIALHYCSRMRAPLEDALSDLSIDVS